MRLLFGGLIADAIMDDAPNLDADASLMARSLRDLDSVGCPHTCATVANIMTHHSSWSPHVCPFTVSSLEIAATKLTRISEAMRGCKAVISSRTIVSALQSFHCKLPGSVSYSSSGNSITASTCRRSICAGCRLCELGNARPSQTPRTFWKSYDTNLAVQHS